MPYKDPKKQKAYRKKWNAEFYANNRSATYARVRARRIELMAWLDKYKSKLSCVKCGEKHPACLDFHHRDSKTKDFSLAIVKGWGYGRERMLSEIKKCMVICANCHRKVHYNLRKKQ